MVRPARVLARCDAEMARSLEACAGIKIAARVNRSDEVIDRALAISPDVAIFDISTLQPTELAAIGQVSDAIPGCAVLVLVAEHDERLVVPLVSAGAAGYLRRENMQRELAHAVDALCRGEVYYDPDVVRILATNLAQGQETGTASPQTGR